MKADANKILEESIHLHLQCDRWSNLKNKSVINFTVSKPEHIFVEVVIVKSNWHNADYLTKVIEDVIVKHSADKILVVIGENAANIRSVLKLINEKFPRIVPLSCLALLLNLLYSRHTATSISKMFPGKSHRCSINNQAQSYSPDIAQ